MKKEIIISQRSKITAISDSLEDRAGNLSLKITGINTESTDGEMFPVNINDVEILEAREKIDAELGLEGELLVSKNKLAVLTVDIDGNLIIADEYADQYSINAMGELIYNR